MEKNGKKEEAKYKHPSGSPIEFYTDELYTFLQEPTHALNCFIEILESSENDDLMKVGQILEDLLEYADQQLEKKVEFIEENLGKISVDIASKMRNSLGLNFTPKGQGAAREKEEAQ